MHLHTTQILLLAFGSLFALTSAGPLPIVPIGYEDPDSNDVEPVTGGINPDTTQCLNATEVESATGGALPGLGPNVVMCE